MTLYRCGRCEEQCRLELEVGAVPDRCPLDGKKFNWDGHLGGADWYHCNEAGDDLTDDDINAELLDNAMSKDD